MYIYIYMCVCVSIYCKYIINACHVLGTDFDRLDRDVLGACRCSPGSLDPRLIGSPAHWIRQLIGLSAEAIQFVTGPWAGNGQTNQRPNDGQTDEWSSAGQTNRWSSRAKSSNCEAGVYWPVVKCWSADQWSSDGQTDQWSSYDPFWISLDHWSVWSSLDHWSIWSSLDHWSVWLFTAHGPVTNWIASVGGPMSWGTNWAEPGIQWAWDPMSRGNIGYLPTFLLGWLLLWCIYLLASSSTSLAQLFR